MWLDVLKVMCLGIFLGGFGRAVAENEGILSLHREPQVTTCSSAPVAEGERGEMVFHLAPFIARTADSLFMYVKKDNETDALSCHKADRKSPIQCDTPNRHFWSEGVVGRTLTLVAPKVTRDVEDISVVPGVVSFYLVVVVGVVIGRVVACRHRRRCELEVRSLYQRKAAQGHGRPSQYAAQEIVAIAPLGGRHAWYEPH
ncbi:uncharacterized protein [Littorina saxatilis]|uniref:uncharacterized protein isoform X2 n=1 Tax=Littorina saxatilis TaxID=31220 RepID=UPI0038B4552A